MMDIIKQQAQSQPPAKATDNMKTVVQQSPIDFISPFTLEECVRRIESHVATARLRLVVQYEEGEETAQYKVVYYRQNELVMHGEGMLKRWGQHFTRCQGTLISSSHNIYHPQFWSLWLGMTALLLTMTVISTVIAMFVSSRSEVALAMLCFWVAVWIVVYFILQNHAAKVSHSLNVREVEVLLMKFLKDPSIESK